MKESKYCPLLLAAYSVSDPDFTVEEFINHKEGGCLGDRCAWWKRNPAYGLPGSSPGAPQGFCAIAAKTGGQE